RKSGTNHCHRFDERSGAGAKSEVDSNNRPAMDDTSMCRHGAVEHVGDEECSASSATRIRTIQCGHVPGTVDKCAVDAFDNPSCGVQHEQTASLCCCRSPIGCRETAYDTPPAAQHSQCCCKPDPACAGDRKMVRVNVSE